MLHDATWYRYYHCFIRPHTDDVMNLHHQQAPNKRLPFLLRSLFIIFSSKEFKKNFECFSSRICKSVQWRFLKVAGGKFVYLYQCFSTFFELCFCKNSHSKLTWACCRFFKLTSLCYVQKRLRNTGLTSL